jgi:branched-chain amino acid transport system permease protein
MLYREVGQFRTSYAADMRLMPIAQDRAALLVALGVAFVLLPLLSLYGIAPFKGEYLFKAILIPFLILSLATIGLNILVGCCGQISLGAGAFMAVGAYAAYNFALRLPELSLLAVLFGGGVAALVGLAFGIPSLRIKGLYLAVATLAAQFFFDWVFLRMPALTNNSQSGSAIAPQIKLFGYTFSTALDYYLIVLTFVVAFAIVAKNLMRGSIGRQWMAIRDMDIAAEIIGISPLHAKLSAFAVSSFIIGVAGALWAFLHLGSWEPLAFNIDFSFQLLFMLIIGGMGSILGSFLGAAFILVLPVVLDQVPHAFGIQLPVDVVANVVTVLLGMLILLVLNFEPQGFARLWQVAKLRMRRWPLRF